MDELEEPDEPDEVLAGAFESLLFDPFVDPEVEPASADFFSDEPLVEDSLPLGSLPDELEEPLDAPSFGRESVR